jgi:hypothetical protein
MNISDFGYFVIVCCSCSFPLLLLGFIGLVVWLVNRGNRKPATAQAPAVPTTAPVVIDAIPATEIENPVRSAESSSTAASENTAALEELRQLKSALDLGVITIEEYQAKVGEILNKL